MSNFSYLSTHPEYSLCANSASEAEKVVSTSPAMCAVGCRKALELAVKWVYAADKTITIPYKDNLQSLLHEPSFRLAVARKYRQIARLNDAGQHAPPIAVHCEQGERHEKKRI